MTCKKSKRAIKNSQANGPVRRSIRLRKRRAADRTRREQLAEARTGRERH